MTLKTVSYVCVWDELIVQLCHSLWVLGYTSLPRPLKCCLFFGHSPNDWRTRHLRKRCNCPGMLFKLCPIHLQNVLTGLVR